MFGPMAVIVWNILCAVCCSFSRLAPICYDVSSGIRCPRQHLFPGFALVCCNVLCSIRCSLRHDPFNCSLRHDAFKPSLILIRIFLCIWGVYDFLHTSPSDKDASFCLIALHLMAPIPCVSIEVSSGNLCAHLKGAWFFISVYCSQEYFMSYVFL